MNEKEIKRYANQRIVSINKDKCDKQNKYTVNNLAALDKAANTLVTKGGFKLYMYLAKNQDNYTFALSSKDFMNWSNLSIAAYRTAFNELVEEKYLIQNDDNDTSYSFYDTPQIEQEQSIDNVDITVHKLVPTSNKELPTIDKRFKY